MRIIDRYNYSQLNADLLSWFELERISWMELMAFNQIYRGIR